MADAPGLSDNADRPDPLAAATPTQFVESMRRLKQWTGLGYRQLEKRAAAGGHALPRSTLTVALTRDTLPREDLVTAFAYACGCDKNQIARWVAARRRIAAGPATDESPVVVPPATRRWPKRVAVVLLAVALVGGLAATYFIRSGDLGESQRRNPEQAAPAAPGPSRVPSPPAVPQSTTVIAPPTSLAPATPPPSIPPGTPVAPPTNTTGPAPAQPVNLPKPGQGQPPTSNAPTPQVPVEPGRNTIRRPGEPDIHCPAPYLGTTYGPVAQCTQQSGDRARPGHYSPITGEFGPTTDWVNVVEKKWYDGTVLATDGVQAWARGYGIMETIYGPGVWATQYRDGEARWGVINTMTNRFYPASNGWQPAGR